MTMAEAKPTPKRRMRAKTTSPARARPTAKAISPARARAILKDWARGIARPLPHDPSTTQHPLCTLSSQQAAQLHAVLARHISHDDLAKVPPLWLPPP
jgi:hypothetical protein